jgi:pimeloyl-ACP methyl ester carboxylesterase
VVIPARNAKWLVERIPGSRLVLFDRRSRCPFIEERELFNHEIATFVGEARAPSADSAAEPLALGAD